MSRGNPDNLVPNEARTPEERRRNATKAGQASGRARRKKRDMREAAQVLLNMKVPKDQKNLIQTMKAMGLKGTELDMNMAILVVAYAKAMLGDIEAARFIRDSAGYDPRTQISEKQFKYQKKHDRELLDKASGVSLDEDGESVVFYLPYNGRPDSFEDTGEDTEEEAEEDE